MDEKLTINQEKAVAELRYLLQNDLPSSIYDDPLLLKRFLIARDYNVKRAEAMIRKNLKWQKEVQLEHVITDYQSPEVLMKYFPITFLGYDKEGTPIEYADLGRLDEKGLLKSSNAYQIRKFIVQRIEISLKRLKPDGSGPCPNILYIFDVSQVSFTRFFQKKVFPVVMKIFVEFQDNYPEIIKNLFVINTSTTFAAIWAIVKDCVGSSLVKKIMIHGEGSFQEEFRRRIDLDILPAFLGGNKRDSDGNPECDKTVNRGKVVPKEYFTELDVTKFLQNPGATSARIGRQKQLLVPFHVTEPNSAINYEFISSAYDIGFGISLKSNDETLEEVIPVHKIETECLPERGKYRCTSTGSYFIIFDNSYSWIHSKDICYRIWSTTID